MDRMKAFDCGITDPVSELVLGAGAQSDIPALREWLAELPGSAYGQVFIESDAELPDLRCPVGVNVSRVAVFFEPGEALASAVDAWCVEWLWAEAEFERSLLLWTGGEDALAAQECRRRIERRLGRREPAVATPVR